MATEGSRQDDAKDDLESRSMASQSLVSRSIPSLTSQSSAGSQESPYNFRKILRWLQFVDENIAASSNHLLYLGAYLEIRDKDYYTIVAASNFYQALKEKIHDDAQTLARFMFALQKLGRKRRGIYCNNHFRKLVKIDPPSLEEYEERERTDKTFAFYQCLMDICVALDEEGNKISASVRLYACRHVLGILPQNEPTVARVFLKMLKNPEILSVDKQEQLALTLGQVGANSCLIILQHFRSQFKLIEIEWDKVKPYLKYENISPMGSTVTLTSGTRSSTSPTLSSLASESLRSSPRNEPVDTQEYVETHERTPLINRQERPELRHPYQGLPPAKKYRWNRILACFLCVGIPLMIAAGAGVSLIVLASIPSSSLPTYTTVLANTTVALGNVQKFTTQHVTLYQDPENGEVAIPLKFYHSNKNCASLPSISARKDSVRNQSIESLQQMLLFRGYLLDGSYLNYNICAVTNIRNDTKFHIDFYIADGVDENFKFNPDTSSFVLHQDIRIRYSHNLKQPSSNCFMPAKHTLRDAGSYSVIILLPPSTEVPYSNISVWYDRHDHLKVIDTSQLSHFCTNSPANKSDPCKMSISAGDHFISIFCIVAKVGISPSRYDQFTHIHASLTDSDIGQIWSYVLGGFVFVVIVSVLALVVVLTYFCRHFYINTA